MLTDQRNGLGQPWSQRFPEVFSVKDDGYDSTDFIVSAGREGVGEVK